MWDKENEKSECRCGGACEMCHGEEPKTKEEKIAHLEKKEAKLKQTLAHIHEMKEAVKSDKKSEEVEEDE